MRYAFKSGILPPFAVFFFFFVHLLTFAAHEKKNNYTSSSSSSSSRGNISHPCVVSIYSSGVCVYCCVERNACILAKSSPSVRPPFLLLLWSLSVKTYMDSFWWECIYLYIYFIGYCVWRTHDDLTRFGETSLYCCCCANTHTHTVSVWERESPECAHTQYTIHIYTGKAKQSTSQSASQPAQPA